MSASKAIASALVPLSILYSFSSLQRGLASTDDDITKLDTVISKRWEKFLLSQFDCSGVCDSTRSPLCGHFKPIYSSNLTPIFIVAGVSVFMVAMLSIGTKITSTQFNSNRAGFFTAISVAVTVFSLYELEQVNVATLGVFGGGTIGAFLGAKTRSGCYPIQLTGAALGSCLVLGSMYLTNAETQDYNSLYNPEGYYSVLVNRSLYRGRNLRETVSVLAGGALFSDHSRDNHHLNNLLPVALGAAFGHAARKPIGWILGYSLASTEVAMAVVMQASFTLLGGMLAIVLGKDMVCGIRPTEIGYCPVVSTLLDYMEKDMVCWVGDIEARNGSSS